MALLTFSQVGITAMCSAAPKQTIINKEYQIDLFGKKEVSDIVDKIGIKERRFAKEDVCSSDLCYVAAERLIEDNEIDRKSIDLIIFVSETPDYKFPQTSLLLQHRLGLSKTCMAFDIPMGCSSSLYAFSVAFGLLQNSGLQKCLLLFGETNSRVYSPKDRASAYIFGDAATALILEKGEHFKSSYFSINSDGSKADYIMVEAGGSRVPSSSETMKERVVDEYGNQRSLEQAWMKGAEVFALVLSAVPRDIKKLLQFARVEPVEVDYFVFHQANGYMINHIAKRMSIAPEKVPLTIEHFGNTGGVSVPFTITECLADVLNSEESTKLLLSAFGIGMTWGSGLIDISRCHVSPRVEI